MSEAQFKKAVEIVGSLPKDGPVKPTTDDQLYVCLSASPPSILSFPLSLLPIPHPFLPSPSFFCNPYQYTENSNPN